MVEFTDPIAFEEYLAPAGGEVRIRPMKGSQFRAKLDMRMSQRIGLFTIRADSFRAEKAPQQDFYGFSIPLNASFVVSESGSDQHYGGRNAHLLSPDRPFDFKCERVCHTMACNVFATPLQHYRERVHQASFSDSLIPGSKIPLVSSEGSQFYRSAARAWIELGTDTFSADKMHLREIEDDLLLSFLNLIEASATTDKRVVLPGRLEVSRTEEYISANLDKSITRDDLAEAAGVSIRNLSRAFKIKYGLSPMAYVRQRRLDACYAQLRGSDPVQTTVTDVAMTHGFSHVGKFAIAYKRAFGESPSASLRD